MTPKIKQWKDGRGIMLKREGDRLKLSIEDRFPGHGRVHGFADGLLEHLEIDGMLDFVFDRAVEAVEHEALSRGLTKRVLNLSKDDSIKTVDQMAAALSEHLHNQKRENKPYPEVILVSLQQRQALRAACTVDSPILNPLDRSLRLMGIEVHAVGEP